MILLMGGMVIVIGGDKFYKKGRISNLKNLLKIKLIGLLITIGGMILMIRYYA
jgi:hypothetical protein